MGKCLFVSGVYDGLNIYLYVDGVEVVSNPVSSNRAIKNAVSLWIGSEYIESEMLNWDGLIQIWKFFLTSLFMCYPVIILITNSYIIDI